MNAILTSVSTFSVKLFFMVAHGFSLILIFNLFFVLVFLGLLLEGARGFLRFINEKKIGNAELEANYSSDTNSKNDFSIETDGCGEKSSAHTGLYISWKPAEGK